MPIDYRRQMVYDHGVSETGIWTVVNGPKFAGMMSFDCAECGHEELTRPVFLSNGGHNIAVGTGCAAKLTGLPVAKFEADLAVARLHELAETNPFMAAEVWMWFKMTRPGRVTPKFLADTIDRYGAKSAELVNEIANIYKAVKRVDLLTEVKAIA